MVWMDMLRWTFHGGRGEAGAVSETMRGVRACGRIGVGTDTKSDITLSTKQTLCEDRGDCHGRVVTRAHGGGGPQSASGACARVRRGACGRVAALRLARDREPDLSRAKKSSRSRVLEYCHRRRARALEKVITHSTLHARAERRTDPSPLRGVPLNACSGHRRAAPHAARHAPRLRVWRRAATPSARPFHRPHPPRRRRCLIRIAGRSSTGAASALRA